ncbi:molecular chaperone TorD family protein [bacterium]|nr:molecular chaperone TorD family protein [bacterium]
MVRVNIEAEAEIFRMFSLGFDYPGRELGECLLDGSFVNRLKNALHALSIHGHSSLEDIQQWTRSKGGSLNDILLDLEREHTRLFITAYPGNPVPIYGSFYLDGDQLLMGASTVEVKRIYHGIGLTFNEGMDKLPDHFSIEMEFAGFLLRLQHDRVNSAGDGETAGIEACRNLFLSEYLLPWAFLFLERLKSSTKHGFFLPLARMAGEFMIYEKGIISNLQNKATEGLLYDKALFYAH